MKGKSLNKEETTPIRELDIFGENDTVLVDQGTYAYNSEEEFMFYVGQGQSQGSQADGESDQSDRNGSGVYGKCEYCMQYNQLVYACACKKVEYCTKTCLARDRQYHEPRCEKADEEESKGLTGYQPSSKKGLMGLDNLGNTCYMNSGIQCLSNTSELTEYILSNEYQEEINEDNPIGTQGKLVRAYANMIKKLWFGSSDSFRPYGFKSALGSANPMFSGYQQQDSQELICFILDKLHEDLNKIKRKPIVEGTEKDPKESDIEAARRAWIGYKRRNHSKIVDLMFGQLRSKLTCPVCSHTSTTFDPFNFVTLPIPKSYKKEIRCFLIRANFSMPTLSYNFIFTSPNATINDFKLFLESQTAIPKACLQIAKLSFKQRGSIYPDSTLLKEMRKEIKKSNSFDVFAVEILKEELALLEKPEEYVSCYTYFNKDSGSSSWWDSKKAVFANYPLLFSCKSTSIQIYRRVYDFLNGALKLNQVLNKDKEPTDEELKEVFKSTKAPFKIILKKKLTEQSSYWSNRPKEEGTDIPIGDSEWVLEKNLELETTHKVDGKYVCEMEVLFPSSSRLPLESLKSSNQAEKSKSQEASSKLLLSDCFKSFEEPETLDEMNTWYCRKCKDHVRALKELRLFKVPEIIIIQLKRFKEKEKTIQGHYRQFHTSVGTKNSEIVDFPLEGLDLEEFVMSHLGIDEEYKLTLDEIFGEAKKDKEQEGKETRMEEETKAKEKPSSQQGNQNQMEEEGAEKKKEKTAFKEEEIEVEFKEEPIEKKQETEMKEKEKTIIHTSGSSFSSEMFEEKEKKRSLVYDLYAVSNHYGSMSFGHYTAYVKNGVTNNWYECDDSRVHEISPSRVVSEAAYVLFYRRRK